jgi:hypothetical protein
MVAHGFEQNQEATRHRRQSQIKADEADQGPEGNLGRTDVRRRSRIPRHHGGWLAAGMLVQGAVKGMNPNCPICRGIGWVCENHPDRAWDSDLGCTCGAGEPCKCNQDGEPSVDEPDTSQIIKQES